MTKPPPGSEAQRRESLNYFKIWNPENIRKHTMIGPPKGAEDGHWMIDCDTGEAEWVPDDTEIINDLAEIAKERKEQENHEL